ncbi:MAG: CatB-related O-acetyltransferase [Alphaproteobacteria bacterium]|nr:CatB-related O-acetyltransferase [Alphaproteobacteria bacterium]
MNFLKRIYSSETKVNKKIIHFLFFRIKLKKKRNLRDLYRPPLEKLGKFYYSAPDIFIRSPETEIGNFCSLGMRVILGHGEHPLSFLSTSPYFYSNKLRYKKTENAIYDEFEASEPIKIGNDVWVGDDVYIKSGIKVGDGAVIGTKSLVTKDVPPYAIVVGCPARVLKFRFDENTIEKLLKLKWWDLEDEIIKSLPYDDVQLTIKKLEELRTNKGGTK